MGWMFFTKPVGPPRTKWEQRKNTLKLLFSITTLLLLLLTVFIIFMVGVYSLAKGFL